MIFCVLNICDSEIEKKLIEKEGQILSLSKKYQDMSREATALKNLVKADFDEFEVTI